MTIKRDKEMVQEVLNAYRLCCILYPTWVGRYPSGMTTGALADLLYIECHSNTPEYEAISRAGFHPSDVCYTTAANVMESLTKQHSTDTASNL